MLYKDKIRYKLKIRSLTKAHCTHTESFNNLKQSALVALGKATPSSLQSLERFEAFSPVVLYFLGNHSPCHKPA